MKKSSACILYVICTIFVLSGCAWSFADPSATSVSPTATNGMDTSIGTTTKNTTVTAPSQGSAAPTAPPVNDPYPQYVQTDINEIIEGSDRHRNNWTIPICVPKLLPFSDDAIVCQNEIESYFDPITEDIRNDSSQGYWPIIASIQHNVYLNNNILSVVIEESTNIDIDVYHVYNFDIESGKRLNTEELMNKLQITDYKEKITQIAQNAFEAKLVGCTPEFLEEHRDLYNTQKEKNNSKENIDKAIPYVAEDGKVMVVVDIYSMAGAECYAEVFPLA